jgi:hypothetical protein
MNMSTTTEKVPGETDAWESGELGRDDQYVRRSVPDDESAVDEALDLQMISIRLQKELIRELKFIAKYHGVGYQPLIRDVLGRWTRSELLQIARESEERERAAEALAAAEERERRRA